MNLGRTIKLIVIILVAIFLVGVCIAVGFQSFQNKAISLEEQIYSESFSSDGIGQAIMNRLLKAAGHKIINV